MREEKELAQSSSEMQPTKMGGLIITGQNANAASVPIDANVSDELNADDEHLDTPQPLRKKHSKGSSTMTTRRISSRFLNIEIEVDEQGYVAAKHARMGSTAGFC